MKIRLKETGEWEIQTAAKGFDIYDDLPEKMKHVLSLVLIRFPYGAKYEEVGDYQGNLRIIEKLCGLRHLSLKFFMFKYVRPDIVPQYKIEINTNTVQSWKRAEERGGRA